MGNDYSKNPYILQMNRQGRISIDKKDKRC